MQNRSEVKISDFATNNGQRTIYSVQGKSTETVVAECRYQWCDHAGSTSLFEHSLRITVHYARLRLSRDKSGEVEKICSAVLGIPCFSADHASIDALQSLVEHAPETLIEARADTGAVTAGSVRVAATIPPGLRDAFVSGQWNPTAMLLDRFDEVRAVADALPYVSGF